MQSFNIDFNLESYKGLMDQLLEVREGARIHGFESIDKADKTEQSVERSLRQL